MASDNEDNTSTEYRYSFVKLEQLHKNLQIKPSSIRKINITKVEERTLQKRFSKAKHTVYIISCNPPVVKGVDIEVSRRYNDFKWLRMIFTKCFPSLFIPPIPPQQILGRFEKSFIEQRRKDLERFLNRICNVKPLCESLIFTIFLSRPEDTFHVSKEEITRNHIPTLKDRIYTLTKLFPDLSMNDKEIEEYIYTNDIDVTKDEYKTNDVIIKYRKNADDLIYGIHIKECSDFLKNISDQMNLLCEHAKKMNDKLLKIKQNTKKFHEAFWRLHINNEKLKYCSKLNDDDVLPIFGDDKRDFYGWFNYNTSMYDVNHDVLWIGLKYQSQDIDAFMDIFKNRNNLLSEYESIKTRNKTWQNLIDNEYELQPHQITQIQMDHRVERLLQSLLFIETKVIINYNVYKIWNQLINDWKDVIAKYVRSQILTHQLLYAECYQDKEDVESISNEQNGVFHDELNIDDQEFMQQKHNINLETISDIALNDSL